MQTTSALYKTIVSGDHWFETKITIDGNEVDEDEIISLDRDRPGMNQNFPSVGGAVSSTLRAKIIYPNFSIPQRAEVKVYYRAKNTTQTSEWLPAGTYYIDTRSHNNTNNGVDTLEITAFDAMIKAEQDYPDTSHSWPYRDSLVVAEIASTIGVSVDSRTNTFLTARWMIDMPISYVMREVLEQIAGMNGGNFIITAENKLLFVPLYGLDPEENLTGQYLTPEGSTDALQFGNEGWYILV